MVAGKLITKCLAIASADFGYGEHIESDETALLQLSKAATITKEAAVTKSAYETVVELISLPYFLDEDKDLEVEAQAVVVATNCVTGALVGAIGKVAEFDKGALTELGKLTLSHCIPTDPDEALVVDPEKEELLLETQQGSVFGFGSALAFLGFAAPPPKIKGGTNLCAGAKAKLNLPNKPCIDDSVAEQAGGDVTKGANGLFHTSAKPLTTSFQLAGMCAVNVHWHLGAEHKSEGEYDDNGKAPEPRESPHHGDSAESAHHDVRYGEKCYHYDESDLRFTTEYEWKHCINMQVGNTYEIHWPHSKAGACGTPDQFQSPFYDGVLCNFGTEEGQVNVLEDLPGMVGVQAQVFTIINDEHYYYPDLMRGMIIDGDYGADMAYYTGSTTGTSRNNEICSSYAPITWQVDRKCHLISASSFDKMCEEMKAQRDDLVGAGDTQPHGAREVVVPKYVADNVVDR